MLTLRRCLTRRRPLPPVDERDLHTTAESVIAGDRGAIAKLISGVESGEAGALGVVAELYSKSGNARTIGLTGSPGAGKSTLTDALVGLVREAGSTAGVIAVDPSSPFSGGAILGDRVRMQDHATDPGVFIRSMATRGHLGGLAVAAPQAMRILDAAGMDVVLVETVGVGQVEIEIVEAVDTTVVVVNPGWGDSVQAAKAGLLEVADVFVVNKADRDGADQAVDDLRQMLDLSPPSDWSPPIVKTVATSGDGVEALWGAAEAHLEYLTTSGQLAVRRRGRLADEVRRNVVEVSSRRALELCRGDEFESLCDDVAARLVDPTAAARRIIDASGMQL